MIEVLDVFSGIGGFSLGLEWAGGFRTAGFCEIDKNCQYWLRRRWPGVWLHDNITTLTKELVLQHAKRIDLICGGFPCQDLTLAWNGPGLSGARSGLWWEMHRLIREHKPRWVIAENVPALRTKGIDTVLLSLEQEGYTAEPHVVGAYTVGASHERERVWILAYRNGAGWGERRGTITVPAQLTSPERSRPREFPSLWGGDQKAFETARLTAQLKVGRPIHGIPSRVAELKALGNSIVPQIAMLWGRAIVRVEEHAGGVVVADTNSY